MISDKYEKVIDELVEQNKKLFEISSKQNGQYLKMDAELQSHFKSDDSRFNKQEEDHVEFKETLKEIKQHLSDLKDVSDFIRGAGLVKKPLMMIISFIVGLVVLIGAVRSLFGFFK